MRPRTALTFMAIYNVIQNTLLEEQGYVAGNLLATGVGLAWARGSGLEWADLGLDKAKAPLSVGLGVDVTGVAWSFARLVRDSELVIAMLDDERLQDVSKREVWYRL